MMMQTADLWQLPDRTQFRWMNGGASRWSVHVEGVMHAPGVIIVYVRVKDATQMPLVR
jgi:hypothetical protein